MNRILTLIPCIFFFLFNSVYAEDIYIYKHKNGNIVITNIQIPQEYETRAQKIGSFNAAAPSENRQQGKAPEVKSRETYNPQEVEKEKKYLEAEIKRLKDMVSADSSKAQYYGYFLENYKANLQLLENDPDRYFSNRDQFEKEAQKLLR